MSETNSELESFRQKWREEVSARAQGSTKPSSQATSSRSASKGFRQTSKIHVPSATRLSKIGDEDEDEEIPTDRTGNARRQSNGEMGEASSLGGAEPQSALEHYEKAVERENEGSLGDSLNLYRKAFRELQDAHPAAVGQHPVKKGRWRLSNSNDDPDADLKDAERDVFVETEGATEKYMYRMQLSLRNAGKGSRNKKLVWQGYWNYNMLTDDTGVFTLRNDKAFFFSRVKSYGAGA
ncbi:hypothetical protein M7I_1659 [Glarea lozoyensis 74030]|uniref:Uncharacterized protein n=1 Tax=Glarea lozoyensis (strain ATCC 74030 / MF5533) TaxID=1104152 RepID=H0EGP0_GLAL7|nr:hypothetical protein M7I_1659 [Glarea lozoyensis 74030]